MQGRHNLLSGGGGRANGHTFYKGQPERYKV